MEKLEIDNFLSITSATLELKKVNVFIGPQAQGKSIIAKLISFFKEVPESLVNAFVDNTTKREFSNNQISKFEQIFPPVYWENNEFHIKYSTRYYSVEIKNKIQSKNNKLCITFSDEIDKAIKSIRNHVKKSSNYDDKDPNAMPFRFHVIDEIRQVLMNSLFKESAVSSIEHVMYIPAGRSFFANLQKNIFSFLTSNIKVDYFIKEFGSIYENTKDVSFYRHISRRTPPSVAKIVDSLICGKFSTDKGQDWITGKNGKVNVADSSSGQQESLPMALMLSTWPYISSPEYCRSFILEEPEAHLFPSAQGSVVSLIANAYNKSGLFSSYTITTHSPYILTALNNLIQAGNALKECNNAEKRKYLFSIVSKNEVIKFEDVSAFIINAGEAKSILDYDVNLIDAAAIDQISNVFSDKFDKLMDIQYSNQD
ncbi:AAA family ATPase [Enterobacter cloacae]|uniref:AAA family ATPase n=1 Tax=Enterobacter cloacae TaxID=550 RepID=UPI003315DA3D